MRRPTLLAGALCALAGCLDPLVSDDPADRGLILPPGSEVPSITTDEEELEELAEHDGVGAVVPLLSGFVDGGPVHYWDFGLAPDFAAPLWVLMARDGDGELVPLSHPGIIDVSPGDPGYSPFWAIWAVEVTDAYGGEVIPSLAALQEAERRGLVLAAEPRSIFLNCPTVHPDTLLEVGADQPAIPPSAQFYYDGLTIPAYTFGVSPLADDMVHVPIEDVYILRRSGEEPLNEPMRRVDMTGDGDLNDSNNILDVGRDDEDYTPLWRQVLVTVPADYASIDTAQDETVADYRSADDLFTDGEDGEEVPVPGHVVAFEETLLYVNCPIQSEPGGR